MGWFKSKEKVEPPFFVWSDAEHSVGVPEFDREHRHLATLMGEVHHALLEHRDRAQAQRVMEKMIHEIRAHFAHEEQVLAEAGYADAEAHGREHAALIVEAQDLVRQFQAGTISGLSLPTFLKKWLISHIQGSDRKYAVVLRRQRSQTA